MKRKTDDINYAAKSVAKVGGSIAILASVIMAGQLLPKIFRSIKEKARRIQRKDLYDKIRSGEFTERNAIKDIMNDMFEIISDSNADNEEKREAKKAVVILSRCKNFEQLKAKLNKIPGLNSYLSWYETAFNEAKSGMYKDSKIISDSAKLMRRKMFVNRRDNDEDIFQVILLFAPVAVGIFGIASFIKQKIQQRNYIMKIKRGEITEKTVIKEITDNFVQSDQFLRSRGLTDEQIVKYKLIVKKLYACNSFGEYLRTLQKYDFVDAQTLRAIHLAMINYSEGVRRAESI